MERQTVTTAAPLQHKVICLLEWLFTVCVICVMVASFCGLFGMTPKPVHDAVSSFVYPRHKEFDLNENPEEEYWFEMTLNMEILLLIIVQGSLSVLLFMGVLRNSKEIYKMWVAIHLLLTAVIILPLFYQYALMTSKQRSNDMTIAQPNTKMTWKLITLVWLPYRLFSILMILTHWLQKPVMKAYANF